MGYLGIWTDTRCCLKVELNWIDPLVCWVPFLLHPPLFPIRYFSLFKREQYSWYFFLYSMKKNEYGRGHNSIAVKISVRITLNSKIRMPVNKMKWTKYWPENVFFNYNWMKEVISNGVSDFSNRPMVFFLFYLCTTSDK